MFERRVWRVFFVCCFAGALLAAPASAEKGGKDKGHGGGKSSAAHGQGNGKGAKASGADKAGDHAESPGNSAKAKGGNRKFADTERTAIQRYYRDTYSGGNCPPGLAKKDNGCMPPGQARRFNAGSRLSDDVVLLPLPSELHLHLAPPVPGYAYGYADGSVIFYDTSERLVIDVVVVF